MLQIVHLLLNTKHQHNYFGFISMMESQSGHYPGHHSHSYAHSSNLPHSGHHNMPYGVKGSDHQLQQKHHDHKNTKTSSSHTETVEVHKKTTHHSSHHHSSHHHHHTVST